MRTNTNFEHFEGRVYQHNLQEAVTGEKSKNPGTPYIRGIVHVAVDDEGKNVIPVRFSYVAPVFGNGKTNSSYDILKKVLAGPTWVESGADAALKVKITAAVDVNDFYNSQGELVTMTVNEGRFISIVQELSLDRNNFTVDMLIDNFVVKEANEEQGIANDYGILSGVIFQYHNRLVPFEATVRMPEGIQYFESLDISSNEPLYTKVWGFVNHETIVSLVEGEESAFGPTATVRPVERRTRSWDVTGAAREPYEYGDPKVMTKEEVDRLQQDRQVHLAEVKQRNDEYQASKNAPAFTNNVAPTARQKITNIPFEY